MTMHGSLEIFCAVVQYCQIVLQNLYKEHGLSYLPDETDTVAVYERRGLEKKTPSTQQDRERRALEGMNHTQQIEMLQGK